MTETTLGVELIAAERQRQITEEGWNEGHDDDHCDGELVDAAICYANPDRYYDIPARWPWDGGDWKPKDRIRDLVRAGALIAAEIDRLKREAPIPEPADD